MTDKPILCLDFDGVIHSYTSGWHGTQIALDPPVPGAVEFIKEALNHFRVAILSSRSNQDGGIECMQNYIEEACYEEYHMVPVWVDMIEFPTTKPSAFVTIDDRAITFTGTWPDIETLKAFQPWNKTVDTIPKDE